MSDYRRVYIKGGCYFFTVVTAKRQPILVNNIQLLREAFRFVRSKHPFVIDAVVILPDHLHCIWTLPDNDHDYSMRWRQIKAYFSRHMTILEQPELDSRAVWQRRFWEHLIRDEHDYHRHQDYIHYNPIKHGYVERVVDWEYSSFHNFVKQGLYEIDWDVHVDKDLNYE